VNRARLACRLLASVAALALAGGCANSSNTTAGSKIEIVEPGLAGFVRQSFVELKPETPITGIYPRGDLIIATTATNKAYFLSPTLDLKNIRQIIRENLAIRPPVRFGDKIIFPSGASLQVYGLDGNFLHERRLAYPLSSDVRVDQRGLLVAGVATETGGRMAVIDPEREYLAIKQSVLVGPVLGAPATFQGIVFIADQEGDVVAVGEENRAVWALERGEFRADRGILADIVVDDFAVYAASTDTKLYAIDRNTGKIRWRFMAEEPLVATPFVTRDRVYQILPKAGLVAINKVEGDSYRKPLWSLPGATRVLGATAQYVFVTDGSNTVIAVDLATGKPRFSIPGQYDVFAVHPVDQDTIYVGKSTGEIASFKVSKFANTANVASR
jgi:outer membrane protein assembly factor BamB